MLPDRDRQLLSAFVDGELSSRQRRHVERLLRRSGEARTLLRRLQEDARELRHLPRPRPPSMRTITRCFRFRLMAVLTAMRYSQVKNSESPLNPPSDW